MKKLTSLILAIVMLFAVTIPVFAVVPPEDAAPLYPDIADDALFIPQATAAQIALLFLDDMTATETTLWDENTAITDIVTLYDAQGNINAYSVEFTTGYAAVSAYMDTPSIILEWSDTAAPLYDGFELEPGDKVVCLGVLDYLRDSGGSTLTDLDNNTVSRASAVNTLASLRSGENISQAEMAVVNAYQVNNDDPPRDPEITDMYANATAIYGGPFTELGASYNENQWSSYISYFTKDLFPGYSNCCSLTAITNILYALAFRYGESSIYLQNVQSVFETVADIGINSTPRYYNSNTGTTVSLIDEYYEDVFGYYGIPIVISPETSANSYTVPAAIESGKILHYNLRSHHIYGNHGVVCYAYSTFLNQSDVTLVTYLEIADGWNSSRRFIDLATSNDAAEDVCSFYAIEIE